MSEASLLCLQNDLLCCVKEGKELFRCHENKGLDNIRLQSQCRHVSDESWAACVAARRQERLEAWCLCLCRPTGVLCQPRPDPTRGHDQDQLERPPAAAVSPPAIRRPPAAASPRAMVGPQSSGGLPSLRTPSVTFTILSLAWSSINLRILGPVVGR